MTAKPIAIVYLRVSTDDGRQDEAAQLPACLQLCEARGWIPEVVRERASGGRGRWRPIWEQCKEQLRRGERRHLVVWSLDRIGRNLAHVAHDLAQLSAWGATVASVQDSWLEQPPGPTRTLQIHMFGWFAQHYIERLSEGTKAGIARARAKGRRIGRPPVDSKQLARALQLVQAGRSVAGAAREARIGRRTLRGALEAAADPGVKGSGARGP